MSKIINIRGKKISINHEPFVIAEISGNHDGKLKRALKLVDLAAKAGADAIKLQTFKPDKITLKSNSKDFLIKDKTSPWYKKNLYRLFKKAYTPWEWHKNIFDKAKSLGLKYLSTPFHEDAVDFLEKLDVPLYKIASFENNHIPLIKYVARTKKPAIISTGMASLNDLKEIQKIYKSHKNQFIFLKCSSSYPAPAESFNLNTLKDMQKKFNCIVGLSDHSIGSAIACSSVSLGARVIEKHLTLDKKDKAIDSFFSSDKNNFRNYINDIKLSFKSLGNIRYKATDNEKPSLQERRSIYATKNIIKGEVYSKDNISVIRPSYGLHPKYYEKIIGKKNRVSIKKGKPLRKSNIS